MESQAGLILKVAILSTVLSVLIKYGGPVLNVTPTPSLALAIVLLPSAIVGLLLWGRKWQQQEK